MRPARDSWVNPALAFALCAAAGATGAWLRLPLPWMIGPLLAMAACNFSGAGLRAIPGGRPAGQIVIGTALGLYFTSAVARQVLSYWPMLLAAGIFAILLGVLCGRILGRIAQTDSATAFFASVPGGAVEMMVLAERFGARPDRVALAQTLRVLVVIIAVPFALVYSGAHGSDAYQSAPTSVHYQGLLALLGSAVAAGLLLDWFGFPNAYMFGPLALAIALTASEIRLSSMPGALSNAAQVLIGCALGARFESRSLESAPRYVAGVLVSVCVAVAAGAGFAAALGWMSGMPVASLVLATAPGGIAEMCITAKVLQLGVPFVTAAHVTRVIVLNTMVGSSYRVARVLAARVRKNRRS